MLTAREAKAKFQFRQQQHNTLATNQSLTREDLLSEFWRIAPSIRHCKTCFRRGATFLCGNMPKCQSHLSTAHAFPRALSCREYSPRLFITQGQLIWHVRHFNCFPQNSLPQMMLLRRLMFPEPIYAFSADIIWTCRLHLHMGCGRGKFDARGKKVSSMHGAKMEGFTFPENGSSSSCFAQHIFLRGRPKKLFEGNMCQYS